VGFHVRCNDDQPVPDGHEVDAAQFFNREELLALNPVLELSRQIGLAVLASPGKELVETDIPGRSDPTYKAYMIPA
jgi:NADH pyrophosphatase NudC (nudix superfamily)